MCTDFLLNAAKDAGFVNGRSMDYASPLHSRLFFRESGYHYTQDINSALRSSCEYDWEGKYAFVGIAPEGWSAVVDGMNSEGLSTGCLLFPETEYPKIEKVKQGLSVEIFCNWVLSSFKTCDEVKKALSNPNFKVGASILEAKGLKNPIHFPVHDAKGNSIVIEFIDGEVQISENEVGVLTNAPYFSWHIENLRNYVSISHFDAKPTDICGVAFKATSPGTGFLGLPGDTTSPSRFVRAAMMKTHSELVEDANGNTNLDNATTLAFHILNTLDIPYGIKRKLEEKKEIQSQGVDEKEDERKSGIDYTKWSVVKDLTRKIYSVRSYDSPQVYAIKLEEVDWKEVNGKQLLIPDNPKAIDLTPNDKNHTLKDLENLKDVKDLKMSEQDLKALKGWLDWAQRFA